MRTLELLDSLLDPRDQVIRLDGDIDLRRISDATNRESADLLACAESACVKRGSNGPVNVLTLSCIVEWAWSQLRCRDGTDSTTSVHDPASTRRPIAGAAARHSWIVVQARTQSWSVRGRAGSDASSAEAAWCRAAAVIAGDCSTSVLVQEWARAYGRTDDERFRFRRGPPLTLSTLGGV